MTFDRRARVLIADADPGVRHGLYKRLLDSEVFSDCVPDGKTALEALATASYAVVILDLSLPGIPAERVLDFIAHMDARTRPVVFVLAQRSARSLDVDIVQIVLRKPCDLKQVAAIAKSCVESAAAASREEPASASTTADAVLPIAAPRPAEPVA